MSIGIWQVVLILVIVLIIFGAGKLPKVMGDVAKGVKNFKSGLKDEDEPAAEAKVIDHGSATVVPPQPAARQEAPKDTTVKTS